ncbi:unnamed protein product [Arctogadus glacialis]
MSVIAHGPGVGVNRADCAETLFLWGPGEEGTLGPSQGQRPPVDRADWRGGLRMNGALLVGAPGVRGTGPYLYSRGAVTHYTVTVVSLGSTLVGFGSACRLRTTGMNVECTAEKLFSSSPEGGTRTPEELEGTVP